MFKINYKKYLIIILFSIPNTFLSIGLLYIINKYLSGNIAEIPSYLISVYFCFVLYSYLLNIFFQTKLIKYNYSMIYDNEVEVLKILHETPLIKFEQFGSERFYSILEDLRVFVFLPSILSSSINSILTIIVCLGYLFFISFITTFFLIVFIICLVLLYYFLNKNLASKYESLRLLNEDYYKYIDDSIKGFKELKLSKVKSYNFFSKYLHSNREIAKITDINLSNKYLTINLVSQYGIYILLGMVLCFLTYFKSLNQSDIVTYIVALLFLNGPINNLITVQNFIAKVFVSNKRINSFFTDFGIDKKKDSSQATLINEFRSLQFKNVSFNYNSNDKETFSLKKIDITIHQGETIFIIGGNGSGKSTFVNILTGLYQASSGEIFLNDGSIDTDNDIYKEMFSVIFTDNFIFSKNYDDYVLKDNPTYKDLLKRMKMDNVIDQNCNPNSRSYSKGQSKRVSMIFALLEEKPILVLDEWAADQDPYFRKYFYEVILPQLKREGKTVIAVTHDDAYFKHADRIIKFDYGQIADDIAVKDNSVINLI